MSTQSVARRGLLAPGVLAAVLLGTVPLLSACGTGKNAQTRKEYEVAEGVQAAAGNVVLLNLQLVGDTGETQGGASTLELSGSINNNTGQGDALTSVTATVGGSQVPFGPATTTLPTPTSTKSSSAAAASASASGGPTGPASASAGGPSQLVGVVPPSDLASAGQVVPSTPPASSSSGASSSASSSSGAPSSAAITSGAASTGLPAKVNPGQPLVLGSTGPHLQISGLKTPVLPGSMVQVTFTFQQSGSTSVAIPVYSLSSRTGSPSSSQVTYPQPEIPRDFNQPEYDLRSAAPSS